MGPMALALTGRATAAIRPAASPGAVLVALTQPTVGTAGSYGAVIAGRLLGGVASR